MSYFPVGGSGKVKVNGEEVKLSEFLADVVTKGYLLKSSLNEICYTNNSSNNYINHATLATYGNAYGYVATQFKAVSGNDKASDTVNITGEGILIITQHARQSVNSDGTSYSAPRDIERRKNGEVVEVLLHESSTNYNNSGTYLGVTNFVIDLKEGETIRLYTGSFTPPYTSTHYGTTISATLFSKDTGAEV